MVTLFSQQSFTGHAGQPLDWKIDCEALTVRDLTTLAELISRRFNFRWVVGVPRGGLALAQQLDKYAVNTSKHLLLIDDVLTTGKSMTDTRQHYITQSIARENIIGCVIFARNQPPDWVKAVFQLW